MATRALPLQASNAALPNPALIAALVLCALVMPNPAGYVGAGGDDYHYVEAARCIAALLQDGGGWCVPETHWATRWPLVAPMAAAFALLGDSVRASMLVPLAYSLMATLLFTWLVERHWGRGAALLGGLAFVGTASFAKGLLQPNVETVELAWQLAAVAAGSLAIESGKARWALVAGLCFGLAVQSRMTSLAWLPVLVFALPLLAPASRRLILPALIGATVPLLLDMLVNALAAGRPLLLIELSAAHTRIASTELPPGTDLSRSPLFNPEFIGGWAPAMGIAAHWSVQGLINLLANPQMGPVLAAVPVLMLLARRHLSRHCVEIRLALAASAYAAVLIYVLAIDPKARMFLPVAAIAAALVGRLTWRLWHDGERAIPAGVLATLLLFGAIETAQRFDMTVAGPMAGRWAREHPGQVAIEDQTRRTLTFDATVRGLPVWPAADRPRLLILATDPCATARPSGAWRVARQADFGRPGDPLILCEFSHANRVGPLRP